jgi:hypothetical protein|tara:strand:- start:294 stop:1523 length:1230 start_codon:yes stop_codon:yes gene_type:complete
LQENKKHIVIISPWHSPQQSVATNRIESFAKYLNSEKFNITVLSLLKNKEPKYEKLSNYELFRYKNDSILKLPEFKSSDTKLVHKLKVVKKLVLLRLVKDVDFRWKKNIEKKLDKLNQVEKIDLIISSFAPKSCHEIVLNFMNKNKEVKWIADMRDEMSKNPFLYDNKLKLAYEKLEKKINNQADAVTVVSAPIVNYFREIMPDIQYIEEIRNGFDNELKIEKYSFNSAMTITYTGNFYGKKYKPDTFFEALMECKDVLPNEWIIKFVGTPNNFNIPREFEKNIEIIPRVPQNVAIEYMKNSDINLLIQPHVGRKGMYTGKLFDYISVKKPILAVIDDKDVGADLIREIGIGYIADFYEKEEIISAIKEAVSDWKNKKKLNFDEDKIQYLHRKYQVKKMEVLIEKILHE